MRASLLTFIFLAWHLFLTNLLLTKSAASGVAQVSESVTVLKAASKIRVDKTALRKAKKYNSTFLARAEHETEKVKHSTLLDKNVTIGCK